MIMLRMMRMRMLTILLDCPCVLRLQLNPKPSCKKEYGAISSSEEESSEAACRWRSCTFQYSWLGWQHFFQGSGLINCRVDKGLQGLQNFGLR